MKRCVRPLFTQWHAGACRVSCKIVQHPSQEETARCVLSLIFRPFLVRFSLSRILFCVLGRLQQQMGLKWFAQFLCKLSKQMSSQECPASGGHRQTLRPRSEFGIECAAASLIQPGQGAETRAAFGNPSVATEKHPADSLLRGVGSHGELATREAKPWWCGGIPALQIFPLAYPFQRLSLPAAVRNSPWSHMIQEHGYSPQPGPG